MNIHNNTAAVSNSEERKIIYIKICCVANYLAGKRLMLLRGHSCSHVCMKMQFNILRI
mgnify:CR=1 FL=1